MRARTAAAVVAASVLCACSSDTMSTTGSQSKPGSVLGVIGSASEAEAAAEERREARARIIALTGREPACDFEEASEATTYLWMVRREVEPTDACAALRNPQIMQHTIAAIESRKAKLRTNASPPADTASLEVGTIRSEQRPAAMPDSEIRKQMIVESISRYSGNCPCPYNSARNGSRCGRRSAWSRPGGASPLCYATDISDEMLASYVRRAGISRAQ